MDFNKSKTYQNLMNALSYELNTKSLYDIYAIQATRDEYIEIARIFEIFSGHDLQHAIIWLRILNGGSIPSTEDNLRSSIENIFTKIYNEYALIAQEEGYNEIAILFGGMANIDSNQDAVFSSLLEEIKTNQVFCKNTETLWICQSCGNILSGLCAPEICPICSFPQGYYKEYGYVI